MDSVSPALGGVNSRRSESSPFLKSQQSRFPSLRDWFFPRTKRGIPTTPPARRREGSARPVVSPSKNKMPSSFPDSPNSILPLSPASKKPLDDIDSSSDRRGPQHSLHPSISTPLSRLESLGTLGQGNFGRVTLEYNPTDDRFYALKAVSKGFLQNKRLEKLIFRERDIALAVNSDFIIRCFATYNSGKFLYFLFEPALGGELFALYRKNPGFQGDLAKARFCVASCALALSYLHQRGILYRDLKLENVLVDGRGRCKISDMGLAKRVGTSRPPGGPPIGSGGRTIALTFCGTPEYYCPEVLRARDEDRGGQVVVAADASFGVDWWTLGRGTSPADGRTGGRGVGTRRKSSGSSGSSRDEAEQLKERVF